MVSRQASRPRSGDPGIASDSMNVSKTSGRRDFGRYQIGCEKECRTPVALRTFNSYVARLIRMKLIRTGSRPDDGTVKAFSSSRSKRT